MTTAEMLTVIAAIGGLVTIIGGVIVNIVVAVRVARVSEKTEGIAAKVDGAASTMLAENKALHRTIAQMLSDKAERKEEASLLAQTAAISQATAASAQSVTPTVTGGPSPAASLVQIDKNTEETARNTARTDAKVQDLKDHTT